MRFTEAVQIAISRDNNPLRLRQFPARIERHHPLNQVQIRLVIADGVGDRLAARIADRILRWVDRSHIRLYRTDELTTMLGGAGFSDIVVSTVYDGGYAIIQSRRV